MNRASHLLILLTTLLLVGACASTPSANGSLYSKQEADRMRQTANAHLDNRDFESARTIFERLLIDNPEDTNALYGLATVDLFTGEFESAARRYQTSAPVIDSVEAYNRWGIALTMTGRRDSAITVFNHALTKAPDHKGLTVNRALTKAIYGQTEEAINDIKTVLKERTEVQFSNQLMLIYVLAGRENEIAQLPSSPTTEDYEELLRRAIAIRDITEPEQRARYIGMAFL